MKIRKSQKRWVAKILVLVMLITCLPMTQKQEARAAGVKVLFLMCKVEKDSLRVVEQRE